MEDKIIKFLSEIENLKSTLRHNWTKTGRQESSAEHSWRAAMFLMIFNDLYSLDIDIYKALKMILIHDIPELIDGDVPGFRKKLSDTEKEVENAKKIFDKLPSPLRKEYFELFMEFEDKKTKEAKFAQAIDKIESQLQHLDSGSKYWANEERGEHMLNYPNKALREFENKNMNKIWQKIKKEITKIT